jgi:hypothetical protein
MVYAQSTDPGPGSGVKHAGRRLLRHQRQLLGVGQCGRNGLYGNRLEFEKHLRRPPLPTVIQHPIQSNWSLLQWWCERRGFYVTQLVGNQSTNAEGWVAHCHRTNCVRRGRGQSGQLGVSLARGSSGNDMARCGTQECGSHGTSGPNHHTHRNEPMYGWVLCRVYLQLPSHNRGSSQGATVRV